MSWFEIGWENSCAYNEKRGMGEEILEAETEEFVSLGHGEGRQWSPEAWERERP